MFWIHTLMAIMRTTWQVSVSSLFIVACCNSMRFTFFMLQPPGCSSGYTSNRTSAALQRWMLLQLWSTEHRSHHTVHNIMLVKTKLSLHVSTRQMWAISCMLWFLQSWGNHFTGGWAGPRTDLMWSPSCLCVCVCPPSLLDNRVSSSTNGAFSLSV